MTNGLSTLTLTIAGVLIAGALAGTTPDQPSAPPPQPTELPAAPANPEPGEWWEPFLERFQFVEDGLGCTRTGDFFLYDDAAKLGINASYLFGREQPLPQDSPGYDLDLLTDSGRPVEEASELGERILPNLFFDLVALDDTRCTGVFYEKGVQLSYAPPGDKSKAWQNLILDSDDYALLLQRAQQLIQDSELPRMPSWLCMMHNSRMTQAKVTGQDGRSAVYEAPGIAWYFADDLRVSVTGPGLYTDKTSLPDAAQVEITFNNDLVFHLFYTDKQLLVVSSDVPGGLLYQTRRTALGTIEAYARGEVNPPTGKTVIYLYPTQPTDCMVIAN